MKTVGPETKTPAPVSERGKAAPSLTEEELKAGEASGTQASPGPQSPVGRLYPLLLIVSVAWIANFLHFRGFGYYEDDWYYLPSAFGQTFLTRFHVLLPSILSFFQGRPLLFFFTSILAYSGHASIVLPYLVNFALFGTTAVLFYKVLRMRYPVMFCTIGALLFVLSPLTTVRQNLDIGFIMGPALICVLTAILLRRRHPVVAWLVAILALFTYESIFLLFLAAPFLDRGLHSKKVRAILVHAAGCVLVVVASVLLRRLVGEHRMVEAVGVGAGTAIYRAAILDLYYSARSFLTYRYAAWVSWRALTVEPFLYLAGFLALLMIVPLRAVGASRMEDRKEEGRSRLQSARAIWWLWNGCGFGLLLLLIGFLTIYFQTNGNFILFNGRDTRFSVSAVPGSSVFLAALFTVASCVVARRLRWLVWSALAFVLSVLFVYSFVIQDDYVRAWDYQRHFFSQVVLLTPDLEPDGLIVVQTGWNPEPGFGPLDRPASVNWQRFGMLISLKSIGDWNRSPEIIFANSDAWKNRLKFGPDGKLHWAERQSGSVVESVVPGRVIVLNESADGVLTRSTEVVAVNGRPITEEPRAPIADPEKVSAQLGDKVPASATNMVHQQGTFEDSAWRAIERTQFLKLMMSPAARGWLNTRIDGSADLALGKPAGQSTTLAGRDASRAVDGLTDGRFADGSVSHTNMETNAWWDVDLGAPAKMNSITIWNRTDCCGERLSNYWVFVSNTPFGPTDTPTTIKGRPDTWSSYQPAPPSPSTTIAAPGIPGRYVRIQLAGTNYLSLAEVQVKGWYFLP